MISAPPDPPLRPLLLPALALGTGAWIGLGPTGASPIARGAQLAVGALVWLVLVRRGRGSPWLALLFLLAGVHAALTPTTPARPPAGWSAESLRSAREEPIVGRWREAGNGKAGWVVPFDGCPPGASGGCPPGAGHSLLLEPKLWAPPDGTPVAVLPGSAVWPWPRGPEPSPDARTRDFGGWSPVAADELVRLGPAPGSRLAGVFARWISALRERMRVRLARAEGKDARGLLQALVLGEREALDRERADLFTRTGTRHLLAISGWHVGLFALLVLEPLVRLARRSARVRDERFAAVLRGLGLASYAALTGAGKPVVRAVWMLGLAGLGEAWARSAGQPRRADGPSLLAAAFALEALLDPAGLRSPSLLLSYAATTGLVVGAGPLQTRLRALFAGRGTAPWRSTWASVLTATSYRWLLSGVAASCAACLATLPIAWTVFGEVVPLGAIVTVLAAPLVAGLTGLAWLGLVLPGQWLVPAVEACARALLCLLESADRWPGTPWVVPPRPFLLLFLATGLAFLGWCGRRVAGRAAAALFGGLLLPWEPAPSGLELVALDVGHGTSIVLRAPGLEALVFDAGSRDRRGIANRALLPLLARWEVAAPWVVLSHGHQDHSGGLEALARRIPAASRWGADAAQPWVRAPHNPRPLDLGPGWISIPAPARELDLRLLRGLEEQGNEGSRALLVLWRGQRILLLGDAEEGGLEGLAVPPGPLRLLLAPHHGSEARGLAPLLARAPPEVVWISSSASPAIARELDRRGLAWRWTGRDGPLALWLP